MVQIEGMGESAFHAIQKSEKLIHGTFCRSLGQGKSAQVCIGLLKGGTLVGEEAPGIPTSFERVGGRERGTWERVRVAVFTVLGP